MRYVDMVCWCCGVLWCVGVVDLVCWCCGMLVRCVGVVCWYGVSVFVFVCWCCGVLVWWSLCVGVVVCWCGGLGGWDLVGGLGGTAEEAQK